MAMFRAEDLQNQSTRVAGWQVWNGRSGTAGSHGTRSAVALRLLAASQLFIDDALCLGLGLAMSALPRCQTCPGRRTSLQCVRAALQSIKWTGPSQIPRQAPFSYPPREIWSGTWQQHQSGSQFPRTSQSLLERERKERQVGRRGVPDLLVVMQGPFQE